MENNQFEYSKHQVRSERVPIVGMEITHLTGADLANPFFFGQRFSPLILFAQVEV